jgi:hypothetical protein
MLKRSQKATDISRAEDAIAKAAGRYPEVIEEGPWGHRAFKIRGKTFLFMGADGDGLSFSVKLPKSGKSALSHRFTEPTHYGLGKAGWVTARFASGDSIPLGTIVAWLDESFRAIAPKKVLGAVSEGVSESEVASGSRGKASRKAPTTPTTVRAKKASAKASSKASAKASSKASAKASSKARTKTRVKAKSKGKKQRNLAK